MGENWALNWVWPLVKHAHAHNRLTWTHVQSTHMNSNTQQTHALTYTAHTDVHVPKYTAHTCLHMYTHACTCTHAHTQILPCQLEKFGRHLLCNPALENVCHTLYLTNEHLLLVLREKDQCLVLGLVNWKMHAIEKVWSLWIWPTAN